MIWFSAENAIVRGNRPGSTHNAFSRLIDTLAARLLFIPIISRYVGFGFVAKATLMNQSVATSRRFCDISGARPKTHKTKICAIYTFMGLRWGVS